MTNDVYSGGVYEIGCYIQAFISVGGDFLKRYCSFMTSKAECFLFLCAFTILISFTILTAAGCGKKESEVTGELQKFTDNPPEITVTVDNLSLDYLVQKTNWDGVEAELTCFNAYKELTEKDQFIPTFRLDGMGEEAGRQVIINFGSYMPDSVTASDAMLDQGGAMRYGNKLIMEPTLTKLDDSSVQFDLNQHVAYFLSSNSKDYEKDWYRLFRVVCRWDTRVCTYAFLINTGRTEKLTEITDHDFLDCEGTYSKLSSSWGIGLTINSSVLPKHYIIEWHVSGGLIRTWDGDGLKPKDITKQHNGYPMTSSDDPNNGEVIWTPLSYDTGEDITIEAYIYEEEEAQRPVAYSTLILGNTSGTFQKK
jgi:hypothetical protein